MLPDTFIAGAQKCGTTMLHHVLDAHPDVYFPRAPQELHFFDIEENYRKGLDWYSQHFDAWKGQRVVAQTSPLYLFEPCVPGRISAVIPNARFIVILRNPVDRAYSHYWHEVKHGAERFSFERALELEAQRLIQGFEARLHYSYAARGFYSSQLEHYFTYFPRDRFLVLRFEDLTRNIHAVTSSCAAFFGISEHGFAAPTSDPGTRNTARMPRSRALHNLGRRVGRHFPSMRAAIGRLNLKPADYPPMKPETRRLLTERFDGEIRRTARITGLTLESWLG